MQTLLPRSRRLSTVLWVKSFPFPRRSPEGGKQCAFPAPVVPARFVLRWSQNYEGRLFAPDPATSEAFLKAQQPSEEIERRMEEGSGLLVQQAAADQRRRAPQRERLVGPMPSSVVQHFTDREDALGKPVWRTRTCASSWSVAAVAWAKLRLSPNSFRTSGGTGP